LSFLKANLKKEEEFIISWNHLRWKRIAANVKPEGVGTMKILGIRIDNLSGEEIEDWVKNALANPPKQKFVVTLNPEIILKGDREESYRNVLNSSDLNLCDGFGIKLVLALKGKKIKARYPGVELTKYLLNLAKESGKKVLVVVSPNSLSHPEEIKEKIARKYGLKVQANYFQGENFFDSQVVQEAEVIFVNFGAPEQERFIYKYRSKFPQARLLVGVGGTFDFLTGKIRRAPRFWRTLGLEWLWRLIQEPKRLRRIGRAVVVFPFKAIREK
jgi:N-acetylglucosaminyldiphosphoundecaprenol N-acetyl-beta-D-mannosaminyltransferase